MILDAPIMALRRLAIPKAKLPPPEICDFCSVALSPHHRHLLEVSNRKIVCSCDACALRFENIANSRFKLIPRESRTLSNFHISDSEWDDLALPIGLVFIFQNGSTGRPMAIYPSPAGATESLLSLESWQNITAKNPCLEELKPDVEALLINRVGNARDYFIVPIDACFELVGLIRKNWRGLSGGEKVWAEIKTFFTRLHEKNGRGIGQNLIEETDA